MDKPHKCFLCPSLTTTAICADCIVNLEMLEAPLPNPAATPEELRAWAKENKITSFSCQPSDMEGA